jgi:hypothetical protein
MFPCVQRGFEPSHGSCRNSACGTEFSDKNYIYPLSGAQLVILYFIIITWIVILGVMHAMDNAYTGPALRMIFSWIPLFSVVTQSYPISMWCIMGIFAAQGLSLVFTLEICKPYHPLWFKWWMLFLVFNLLTADIATFSKVPQFFDILWTTIYY